MVSRWLAGLASPTSKSAARWSLDGCAFGNPPIAHRGKAAGETSNIRHSTLNIFSEGRAPPSALVSLPLRPMRENHPSANSLVLQPGLHRDRPDQCLAIGAAVPA